MDFSFSDFLSPLDLPASGLDVSYHPFQLGALVKRYESDFPDVRKIELAIVGVCDGRLSVKNAGSEYAPTELRRELYKLYKGNYALNIHDLGDIKEYDSPEQTHEALQLVLEELFRNNVTVVILGGGHDLSLAQYKAHAANGQLVYVVVADDKIDFADEDPLNSENFLKKILLAKPKQLANFTQLGYQQYLNDVWKVETIETANYEAYRLGVLQSNPAWMEASVRNADMLSIDISMVRMSEAPASKAASPNGFFGNELCQLCRYAGYSQQLRSIGFYEINPECDVRNQTAALTAQAIWCFIDGFYNRKNDFPHAQNPDSIKYNVSIDEYELVFWKSVLTDRWWMEMPASGSLEKTLMVPCTYDDYLQACKNELPDRWMRAYRRLM